MKKFENSGSGDEQTLQLNRRMMIKGGTMLAGLALAGGTTGFLSLTGAAMAQAPQRGGHLKIGLEGGASTDSLDPASYSSTVSFVVGRTWGDTLVETSPTDGSARPSLATEWKPSADASQWTFKIRDDVKFHNGDKMTLDDVVASIQRHTDSKSQSGAFGLLRSVVKIEAVNNELVITLKEGSADLPLIMSDYHLIIQPKGGVDNPLAGIGTGPYKVESYQAGVRALFSKNKDDWRSDRGYVDSVEILSMNDTTARIAALSSGQVHYVNRVDPKTISLLKRSPNVEILSTSGKGFYCFPMHCNSAPFDNNDLRLALKYAIDREGMVKSILGGYGKVGNDFPINSNYALAPDDIEQRSYDPDKAAFHFKKSGHDGAIVLRTSDAAFPGAVDASVLFQQTAKKAGIQLEIKREPADGYWTNVWNSQPFCASYWGARATQDLFYSTSYLKTSDWNDTRFMRDDFEKLLMQARAELDQDKRKAIYRDMAVMVRDEGGLILPMFNDHIGGCVKKMKGYVADIGNDASNGYVASRVWLEA